LSDTGNNGRPAGDGEPKGAYTLTEILSQPLCWKISLRELEESGGLTTLTRRFAGFLLVVDRATTWRNPLRPP
jgi:hypothetical protein